MATEGSAVGPLFTKKVIPDLTVRAKEKCFRQFAALAMMALLCYMPISAQDAGTPATKGPETQSSPQAPKTAPNTMQVLPSYEGQNVSSIELAGQPNTNLDAYSSLLVQHAGEPFSRQKVEESIAAIRRTGKFEEVQLEVLPEATGVRVLLVLHPAVYYGIFRFPGAEHFSYSRLLQVANYPPGVAYTQADVQQAQVALETFFRRDGFFLAEVSPELQVDSEHGLVNVIFHSNLGRRAKFGDVEIEGTTQEQSQQLERRLRSLMARLRGSAIRPGKSYRLKTLQNATKFLSSSLARQKYLAAQVHLIGANYHAETNRADISFHVDPGPQVNVKIEGARLWPWTRNSVLPIYQQAGVTPEIIQEGKQNLIAYFQSKGFFNAQVSVQVQPEGTGKLVLYQVTKGPRHKVTGVSISGNQHIPGQQLMDHVTVKKAHFLSRGKYSEPLLRSSVNSLTAVYQAAGFSSVKVTPQLTHSNGNIDIAFEVDEGPQDIVQSLQIEGNDTMSPAQFAPQGLKLAPGKPYSAQLVGDDRTQIMANYLRHGYLTARFRATAQRVSGQRHSLEVVYHIYEGPLVRTSSIVTLGREKTRQQLINRQIEAIQQGQPLTEDALLTAESRLYTLTGVFDWAEVATRRQVTTQTEEDVVVKLHEAQPNTLTYSYGFEVINRGGSIPSGTVALPNLPPIGLPSTFKTSQKTFYGPRGSIVYTRNNLRGKGESLTFTGFAGRLDQSGSATYLDPIFRWTNWTQSLSASGEHNSENPIFTSRQGAGSYQLARALGPRRTQHLFLRYTYSETGLTRLLIPQLVSPENLHVRLSTLSASYVRDTRDNPLDAHRGSYDSAEIAFNPSVLGSSADFAKFLGQAAFYKKIPDNIIWANSARIGLAQPFSGSFVPLSQMFFSGGGNTLRGFPLDGAGPQQTIPACGTPGVSSTCSFINVPTGGNQLVILNSEFRVPLTPLMKNLSFVAFYDGGNVFSKIGFHGQYTNSLGGGIRYSTPVGPIRFDIGHNLNAPRGIQATQYFITIGQAF